MGSYMTFRFWVKKGKVKEFKKYIKEFGVELYGNYDWAKDLKDGFYEYFGVGWFGYGEPEMWFKEKPDMFHDIWYCCVSDIGYADVTNWKMEVGLDIIDKYESVKGELEEVGI